jgi:hypothetical protein
MKRFLASLTALAVLAFAGVAYAGSVTQMTGPAGTNPVTFPAAIGDYNTIINAVNAAISQGATVGNLSTGIFSGASFQVGKASTATLTMTSQPASLQTLGVSFFLTFTDSQGVLSFIPVWH